LLPLFPDVEVAGIRMSIPMQKQILELRAKGFSARKKSSRGVQLIILAREQRVRGQTYSYSHPAHLMAPGALKLAFYGPGMASENFARGLRHFWRTAVCV
jgi:hypothetical protein